MRWLLGLLLLGCVTETVVLEGRVVVCTTCCTGTICTTTCICGEGRRCS